VDLVLQVGDAFDEQLLRGCERRVRRSGLVDALGARVDVELGGLEELEFRGIRDQRRTGTLRGLAFLAPCLLLLLLGALDGVDDFLERFLDVLLHVLGGAVGLVVGQELAGEGQVVVYAGDDFGQDDGRAVFADDFKGPSDQFGEHGFMRIRRGTNEIGIEDLEVIGAVPKD